MSTKRAQIHGRETSQARYAAIRAHVIRPGRILLGRRASTDERWTTFGGKPESGESPEETLRRELIEELGIDVLEFKRLPDRDTTWDGEAARVAVFAVTSWRGKPRNRARHEHSAIAWFRREELKSLPMSEQAYSEAINLL
ncbi:MAG: NUDIX domain-containing protein [Chloroflexi bacterium]|nr:NUDIX domain-containing protein [Chloroflexota bacterium]